MEHLLGSDVGRAHRGSRGSSYHTEKFKMRCRKLAIEHGTLIGTSFFLGTDIANNDFTEKIRTWKKVCNHRFFEQRTICVPYDQTDPKTLELVMDYFDKDTILAETRNLLSKIVAPKKVDRFCTISKS